VWDGGGHQKDVEIVEAVGITRQRVRMGEHSSGTVVAPHGARTTNAVGTANTERPDRVGRAERKGWGLNKGTKEGSAGWAPAAGTDGSDSSVTLEMIVIPGDHGVKPRAIPVA